jgi:DNA-binding MarR family transcriptional regulator
MEESSDPGAVNPGEVNPGAVDPGAVNPATVDPGAPDRRRWLIIDLLRRYGTDASAVGHAFSAAHGLQVADLQALVAIMSAEGRGAPLSPKDLRRIIGLSSGGTSYVIDRLEEAGHIVRERSVTDRRVVRLRFTEQGMATGVAFFGPLGARTEEVIDEFTGEELDVIVRFLTGAAASMREHLENLLGHEPTPDGFGGS